jgi:hypothetical protein
MEYQPHAHYVEAALPSCLIQPCIENFLGFHPQVWSITLLLPSESFSLSAAKIIQKNEHPNVFEEKLHFYLESLLFKTE